MSHRGTLWNCSAAGAVTCPEWELIFYSATIPTRVMTTQLGSIGYAFNRNILEHWLNKMLVNLHRKAKDSRMKYFEEYYINFSEYLKC